MAPSVRILKAVRQDILGPGIFFGGCRAGVVVLELFFRSSGEWARTIFGYIGPFG
jgi:hypothetical protein